MQTTIENLKTLLPVGAVIDTILQHTEDGSVAIVTGSPQSGASLLIPAALANATNTHVLVLTPRRAQALTGAESLRLLAGEGIARHVEPLAADDAPLDDVFLTAPEPIIFMTYHDAMESGVVLTAYNVVLDHADDPAISVTLCKAVLNARTNLRNAMGLEDIGKLDRIVVILTALADTSAELDYWSWDWPAEIQIPEKLVPDVEILENDGAALHIIALDQIDRGHTGVLVFVASEAAALKTAAALHAALKFNSACKQITVETLLARSSAQDHLRVATAPAVGEAKIVVGTAALLSIMNASWATASVSSGTCLRLVSVRPDSTPELKELPLTQIELVRQVQITGQHGKTAFVLGGGTGYVTMDLEPQPEIQTLSIAQIVMTCAGYGIDPLRIRVPRENYDVLVAQEVRNLRRLGFLDDTNAMTDIGEIADGLPVRAEVAAFLCHAASIGVLQQALPMASVMENNGIRQRRSAAHDLDATSDWFDAAKAFTSVYRAGHLDAVKKAEFMTAANVSPHRYRHSLSIMIALEKAFRHTTDFSAFVTDQPPDDADVFEEMTHRLRQCLLASGLNTLGVLDCAHDNRWPVTMFGSSQVRGISLDEGTTILRPFFATPVSVTLHTVTPRDSSHAAFTVAENITVYRWEDFVAFSKVRPDAVQIVTTGLNEQIVLFGETFFTRSATVKVLAKAPGALKAETQNAKSKSKTDRKQPDTAGKNTGVSDESLRQLRDRFQGAESFAHS